jgi:hypothetical protein
MDSSRNRVPHTATSLLDGDASAEVKLGRGYDATRTALREDKKLMSELLKHIQKALVSDAVPVVTKKTAQDSEVE